MGYGKGLVNLFLSFPHNEFGVRMVDNVLYFIDQGVLEKPDPHTPCAQRPHLGPEPFRTVVSDHRHLVAFFKAEADKPEGDMFDIFKIVVPSKGPPYAELLLPHGNPLFSILFRLTVKELGDGQLFCYFIHSSESRVISLMHISPLHPDMP